MNDALFQSAVRAQQAGDFQQAANFCRQILRNTPKHFGALYMLGFLYAQIGRDDDAEKLIGQALLINPRSPDALFNRGSALARLNRHEEALASFDAALALAPGLAPAHVLRATILIQKKRFAEALAAADKAIGLNKADADAWNNRGNALSALNRRVEALAAFDRVLALNLAHAEGWSNRGFALNQTERLDEAVANFDRSLTLKPSATVEGNRATSLSSLKRYEEAARGFEKALALDPALAYVPGDLALARFQACDWRHADADRALLRTGVAAEKRVVQPQVVQVLFDDPAVQLRAIRAWTAHEFPSAPPVWRGERYGHKRIRIAYLSADFWAHATAYLMAGVFEHHDRDGFETVALSFGSDKRGPMRTRLEKAFDRFLDVRGKTDGEVAALMREMEIDIAVDLKGFTGDARPGIFALRPAPVQVNYLGFPGTTGAPYMDYLVADSVLIPEGQEKHYSEVIVRLPDSYQANDDKRPLPACTLSRRAAGLPEEGIVFCSFNNSYKIMPEMFSTWMRILAAVPESVLWLLADNPDAMRNLRREAEARGIAAERLVFAARITPEDHLARHGLADLFLDTLPCNAHTTASDALWAGLPVLTCQGRTFAGRVAASLLHAVGLPELVTDSPAAYEAMAIALARDEGALVTLKAKLRGNRETCPLFDTARFTRRLEAAYRQMWRRAEEGEKAAAFTVPASA